jgi:hypothetical protein
MKKHPSGPVITVGLRMLTTDFSTEGGRKAVYGTKTGSDFPVMEFLISGGRNPTLETETLTFCRGRRVLLSTTISLAPGLVTNCIGQQETLNKQKQLMAKPLIMIGFDRIFL